MNTPNEREQAYIVESLRRLREHFKIWPSEGAEHDLLGFALYEGCYKDAASGRIIAETAPFALGHELVSYYGFEWVIITRDVHVARYAVWHPRLERPIDLLGLEDGEWADPDARCDEPPSPGELTLDSLVPILKAVGLRPKPVWANLRAHALKNRLDKSAEI